MLTHARTHARTHTRTHARTHARTHTHTHTHTVYRRGAVLIGAGQFASPESNQEESGGSMVVVPPPCPPPPDRHGGALRDPAMTRIPTDLQMAFLSSGFYKSQPTHGGDDNPVQEPPPTTSSDKRSRIPCEATKVEDGDASLALGHRRREGGKRKEGEEEGEEEEEEGEEEEREEEGEEEEVEGEGEGKEKEEGECERAEEETRSPGSSPPTSNKPPIAPETAQTLQRHQKPCSKLVGGAATRPTHSEPGSLMVSDPLENTSRRRNSEPTALVVHDHLKVADVDKANSNPESPTTPIPQCLTTPKTGCKPDNPATPKPEHPTSQQHERPTTLRPEITPRLENLTTPRQPENPTIPKPENRITLLPESLAILRPKGPSQPENLTTPRIESPITQAIVTETRHETTSQSADAVDVRKPSDGDQDVVAGVPSSTDPIVPPIQQQTGTGPVVPPGTMVPPIEQQTSASGEAVIAGDKKFVRYHPSKKLTERQCGVREEGERPASWCVGETEESQGVDLMGRVSEDELDVHCLEHAFNDETAHCIFEVSSKLDHVKLLSIRL